MKLREFNCFFDPETKGLTYGYRHVCTDGFTKIKVREVSPDLDAAYSECERALSNVNNWFEELKNYQEPILEHNFKAASDPEYWPDELKSFSFDEAKNALAALKKAREE
jgi:hypothetical protein